ncbi:hypothetical protein ACFY19_03075 [Streptosporangium saharense]|uniref:hypothetical protein n=1 Tax=Streptosporangium saharense TaxID=1706840 RepID=UPI0036908B90
MHKAADVVAPETSGARKLLPRHCEELALAHDPATPMLPAEIRRMLTPLDRTALAGMCDAVLVLLGYAIAARSSELAALNIGDVTETAVPYGPNSATCPMRGHPCRVAALAERRPPGPQYRVDAAGGDPSNASRPQSETSPCRGSPLRAAPTWGSDAE